MTKTKLVLESRDPGKFAGFKKLKKSPSFIDENGPSKLISENKFTKFDIFSFGQAPLKWSLREKK